MPVPTLVGIQVHGVLLGPDGTFLDSSEDLTIYTQPWKYRRFTALEFARFKYRKLPTGHLAEALP